MAYRQIHTSIWKDNFFLDLESQEKLLFIYLFSNDSSNLAGLYEISKKIISFETGMEMEFINQALEKFSQADKIHYEDGICWVVNLRKYNDYGSDTTMKHINANLAAIQDCPIKRRYLEMWKAQLPVVGRSEPPSGSDDTPPVPHGYPIDTPAVSVTESETESITKTAAEAEEAQLSELAASSAAQSSSRPELQSGSSSLKEPITGDLSITQLVARATGMVCIPPSETARIEQIHSLVDAYGGERVMAAFAQAYAKWTSTRRTDDSRPYRRTNFAWVDWAQEILAGGSIEDKPMTREEKYLAATQEWENNVRDHPTY